MRRLVLCMLLPLLALTPPAKGIVNGEKAEAPWGHMAALEFFDGDSWSFICGASLVRPDVVLTAAHCIDGSEGKPGSFRLLLGTNDRQQGGERIGVETVVEHPDYDDGVGGSDVALLKLTTATAHGPPIRIADPENAADAGRFEPGDRATIIGWGATFFQDPPERHLLEAEVTIRSDDECKRTMLAGPFERNTMICAGEEVGGSDSCQGDSGGPLMVPDGNEKFILVGAVSFGLGCAFPTQYGVYAELAGATLRPWIEQNLDILSPASPATPPQPGGIESPGTAPTVAAAGGGAPPRAGGSAPRGILLARLSLPRRLGSAARARRARRLSVLLATTVPLRGVRVSLRQRSRTVARGSLGTLIARGRVRLRVSRQLQAGPAVLTAVARDGEGRRVRVVRRARLSR